MLGSDSEGPMSRGETFCGEVSAEYFLTLQFSTQLSSALEIKENIYEYVYPLIPLSG